MKLRTFALSSSVLALAFVLAGCSTPPGGMGMDHTSTPNPSSDSAAAFNNADETFVMDMIAHHEQAIAMADLLLDKDGVDERVINLALDIKDAQGPEIETMNRWLDEWGIVTNDSGMEGMDHSGGMMSDEDMAALETASGADASRLFLEQMTQHHQGAIDMAQQELNNGENPEALELAQTIIDAQTAEIATMQDILATL
jgi:uncharacterized protein (DUF305 family)